MTTIQNKIKRWIKILNHTPYAYNATWKRIQQLIKEMENTIK